LAELLLHLEKLRQNLDTVLAFAQTRNLSLLLVTKVIQSRPDLLTLINHPALSRIADLHAVNLAKLPRGVTERAHLRPRVSNALETARHCDRVFLSDTRVAQALAQARESLGLPPLRVSIMVEAGDLRDGVPWDDLPAVVKTMASFEGITVEGLGVNLGCLSGVIPTTESMERCAEGLRRVRKLSAEPLPGFSVGGTVYWEDLRQGFPAEFTEFRLGEAAFFGYNTSKGVPIMELEEGVFTLDLEVLEVWKKNVGDVPPGEAGLNAFGQKMHSLVTGLRQRAVLDGGENLAPMSALRPLNEKTFLVGQTHEYTVLDCTGVEVPEVGGRVSFHAAYEAVARSFLSPFLQLRVIEQETL